MVSTEENSLSDLLGAALPKGVLAGLPGLRGISSPDLPAFAAKPAIEAFSYGTATPAMGELAEAALAYTHDEPHAATTQAPATLALVADNGAAGEDAESADVKAEATQLLTEILRMDPEVKAGLGAEIALLKAAQQSGRASGIDFERIRDRIDAAVKNAENGKAETAEQKIERLREEIRRIDESLDEQYRRMVASGQMSQATYDEWKRSTAYAAAHQEDMAAQTAAQVATEKAQAEAEGNAKTPEEIAAANGTRTQVDRRGEYVAEYSQAIEANQNTGLVQNDIGVVNAPTGELRASSAFRAPLPAAEAVPTPSEAHAVIAYADVPAPIGPQANLPNVVTETTRGTIAVL